MKAMGRRKFLKAAAMLGAGSALGAAALLGTGCASGSASARTETGADEPPEQDGSIAQDASSADAGTAKSEAGPGEPFDPPAASIEPAEQWLIGADTTPVITAESFLTQLARVSITKVDWKTSTIHGCIDQAGRLLYYSDYDFTATRGSQDNIVLSVTSTEGNGGVCSYTLDQDGASITASSGLSYSYPFLEQEGFSDVVSATPIAICPPGNMATSGNALKYISSYVLVRHSQTGFTSYDRWEIRDTDGDLLFEFEFDETITDCQAYTDPSESLFYIEATRTGETTSSSGETTTWTNYLGKVYHRVTQEWTDLGAYSASIVEQRFGDTYFLVDTGINHQYASYEDNPTVVLMRYEDGAVLTLDFPKIGDADVRHYTYARSPEQNGWVLLQAGYAAGGTIISTYSYSVETGAYYELDETYAKEGRIDWSSGTSPYLRTADGEHALVSMQGDDGLSYAAVFDMTWNLLFDPVRADAVLGEGYDGKFAVRIGDALSPATYVFYDLEGNELNTIEASEGVVLDADATFDRTNQGVVTFERTDNPGVPCAIDLTGTILFEGIDVSQAKKFVIEESEE